MVARAIARLGRGLAANQTPAQSFDFGLEPRDLIIACFFPQIEGAFGELGRRRRRVQALLAGLVDAVELSERSEIGGHLGEHLLPRGLHERSGLAVARIHLQDALAGAVLRRVVG